MSAVTVYVIGLVGHSGAPPRPCDCYEHRFFRSEEEAKDEMKKAFKPGTKAASYWAVFPVMFDLLPPVANRAESSGNEVTPDA